MSGILTRLVKRPLTDFPRDQRGVSGIEMALIMPVMLLTYLGLVDYANALSAARRVTVTTNIVGDLITQQSGGTITKADLDGLFKAAKSTFEPYDVTGLAIESFGFTLDVNANVKQAWRYNNGVSCPESAPAIDTAAVKNLAAEGNDVVVSRVCYTVEPVIGFVMKTKIPLSEQIAQRPRYSAKLACSDC